MGRTYGKQSSSKFLYIDIDIAQKQKASLLPLDDKCLTSRPLTHRP